MVSLLKRKSMVEDGGRRTALGYVGTHVCIMEILMPDLHLCEVHYSVTAGVSD